MSTVDDRIVRMQFDNAQFEAGVMRSMKTLDELNEKLQFKEASKGLSALMVTIEGVSSKSVSAAVGALDKISSYSTTVLGMIAQKIKTQFADKIVDAIEAIPTRAMSQIKSGGWNRAMNIANAKFQIEGLKYSWDAVREAADYAVTDTAYGLDAAAKAASQLAASGVDFEEVIGQDGAGKDVTQMHRSLRAISGVAAMTNASYDDIAHTFTRIAGQGRVMANDLNSLASRGLNAAATLAQALGTTEAEVRDMVSKGAIDFQTFSEAMDEAYGDHAKEANKTFTGSLSNMKAALSRIGAIFTQPVIDKTNTFFVAVTDRIKEFQKALNDTTAADGTKTLRFAGHFAEAWESGINAASKFVKFINLDWFQSIGSGLDNLAIKAKTVFDGVSSWFDKAKASADKLETIGEKAKMTVEDLAIVEAVIRGDYGNGLVRINEFAKKGLNYDRIQGFVDEAAKVNYNLKQLGWTVEDLNKETEEATKNGSLAQLQSERLSKTVGNFFNALRYGRNTIVNIGTAVKTVLGEIWFSVSEAMAGPLILSRRISTLMHSIDMLTKDLQPTESILNAIGDAAGTLWHDFDMLTESVLGTANSVIRFAAQCLRSEKTLEELADNDKLTPLQQSVLSVMRVIKNLGIVVANVASSVYKIVRAIVKGIGRAFNPSGVLGGVADFSEGLVNLSEKFKVTDEFAETLSNVFETLATIVFKVAGGISKAVGSIVKFITSIGNAKKPTETVKDTLEGVEQTGEKADTIFDKLKTTLEKFKKKIEELPQKFEEFKNAVNQQEGVIHLKESFDKLKTSIKENLEKLEPFKKGVEEVAEEAGGEGETTIGKLANGIGIVAGKLADFIDKLPTWGQKIEEFWNGVKTTVETWISAIHLDKFFDNLGEGVTDFFTSDESLIGKIKSFADKVFIGITGALEDVDWDKVGKGSMIALIAANLFSFFKISSGIATTINGFASIPKNIGKIFKELGGVFYTANKSLKQFTKAYVFSAVVSSLMLIVSAIMVLGTMDEGELKQGIAALVWIGIFMMMLGKLINAILGSGDRYFNKQKIKEIDKSQKNLLQINNKLGGFIGAGILLAGIGAAIWLAMQGVIAVSKEMKSNAAGVNAAIGALIKVLFVVGIAFAAVALASKFLSSQTRDNQVIVDNLFGAGILLAGIGVAVYLIAKGFIELAKELDGIEDPNSIKVAAGIIAVTLAVLAGFVFLAGAGLKGVDWKSILPMALVLGLAVLALGLIVAEVLAIGYVLNKFNEQFPAETVLGALAIMATIMLTMGLMIYLMGRSLSNVEKPGALIGLVFMMALFVGAVAASLILIAKSLNEVTDLDKLKWGIGGMIAILLVVMVGIGAITAIVSGIFYSDQLVNTLLSLGAIFVMTGVMLLIIAEAIAIIDTVSVGSIIAVGAMLLVIFGVIGIIMAKLAKKPEDAEKIQKGLLAVAVAFLAIASAALIIAGAIALLSTVTMNTGLAITLGAIVLVLAGFAALGVYIASKNMGKAFMEFGAGIALMGAAFLLAGAGIWVAAKGLELIVSISGGLVKTVIDLSNAISEHWPIFLGILAGLALLVWLVTSIIKYIGPISNVIMTVVEKVISTVSTGIELLGKKLKEGGKNFSTWWKNLQPKLKIGIVTGIGTLCAAILKASPELLKTIKELIKKVIFFIIDIIPTVVDGLVEILLRIINSLADTIRKNSARIAYAFWNVLEALMEILIDVLFEGIALLVGGLKKVPILGKIFSEVDASDYLDAAMSMKTGLRKNLSTIKEYADTAESAIESTLGFDASMNKIEKDLNKEAISYENTTAALEQYKGELRAAKTEEEKAARSTVIDKLKDKLGLGDGFDFSGFSTEKLQNMLNMDSMTEIPGFAGGQDMPDADFDWSSYTEESGEAGYDTGITYDSEFANGMEDGNAEVEAAANRNIDTITETYEQRKGDVDRAAGRSISAPVQNQMNYTANVYAKPKGEETVRNFIDGMTEEYDRYAKDPIKYTAKNATNTFNKNLNEGIKETAVTAEKGGKQVSKNVMTGLDAGLAEFSKDPLKHMGGYGKQLVDTANKAVGANSPSKKFYQTGLWCVLGLQKGLSDNSNLAIGTVGNLGESMVSSIGDSMDYVAKIASGEIEYDPRIRPVLDVTNVGRGASDISSMFANQNVSLSGLSGQIAYDMTNLNGSNAAVVSELQALREDMNYMTEEMANMQIVMDTGALVGSTVGAYDEALGRRAYYGERGN